MLITRAYTLRGAMVMSNVRLPASTHSIPQTRKECKS